MCDCSTYMEYYVTLNIKSRPEKKFAQKLYKIKMDYKEVNKNSE